MQAAVAEKLDDAAALPAANVVHCADVLPFLRGMGGEGLFDVVVADPPYNIGKDFGEYGDNLPLPDYVQWGDAVIDELLRLAKPAAPVYVYGFAEILAHLAVRRPPAQQRWLAWHYTNKTVPTLKFWQRSHESILCLWKGRKPVLHVDAVREKYTDSFLENAAGKVRKETLCRYSAKGRKTVYAAHPNGALPRDVLRAPALAGGAGYSERWFYCKTCRRLCAPKENAAHAAHAVVRHPTQKPQEISLRLLKSAAAAGDWALIPFAGSGAECVAAQTLGVNFIAADNNPDYVQLANAWVGSAKEMF